MKWAYFGDNGELMLRLVMLVRQLPATMERTDRQEQGQMRQLDELISDDSR